MYYVLGIEKIQKEIKRKKGASGKIVGGPTHVQISVVNWSADRSLTLGCIIGFAPYSLRFGKRRCFGQDLSQTLGI
jgi:hypothetical protein